MSLSATVFIDLAELLVGLREDAEGAAGRAGAVDWASLLRRLATDATAAALTLSPADLHHAETRIYVRSDAAYNAGAGGAEAAAGLTATSGVTMVRVKAGLTLGDCLACDLARTPRCRHCRNLSGGAGMFRDPVGNAIATDLFRLAREGSLDVAVLVSADRSLVSVVRFLEGRGVRVVVGGFSPGTRELGKAGSGTVDLTEMPS